MRVVLLGRKPGAAEALKYLLEKEIEVVAVVGETKGSPTHYSPRLIDIAEYYSVPVATDSELYEHLESLHNTKSPRFNLDKIDLVISMMFRKRIEKPLIDLPKIGCINFHPAPLPGYRGYAGYNLGIYENVTSWAVSAHFIEESFDTGDIIKVLRFDINQGRETAFSLEQKSQVFLLELFKKVIDMVHKSGSLPRIPQGKGRYFSFKDFEQLRMIKPEDTIDEITRKIRAFWYPPYEGASIKIKGKTFTLVDSMVLKEAGGEYHK